VTLRSVLVERDTSGTRVAPIDEWGLHWAFVVHDQRHNMVPVRRLAGIIKSSIVDAVRSAPWSGASIVGADEPRQANGSAGRPRRNLP
jgi:hypothetical protein